MQSILTPRECNVLGQLSAGAKYGLKLVAGSGGLLRRSTVYVVLARMEEKKLIEGRVEATPRGESGPPRRVYRVTRHGAQVLAVVLDHAAEVSRKRGARPTVDDPFSDSFSTNDACFSVGVKVPWGECTEDIEVKIDCGGMIHGDEDLIDVLIDMLEKAQENLTARRKK